MGRLGWGRLGWGRLGWAGSGGPVGGRVLEQGPLAAAVEGGELLLEVALEPGAVLPLEGAQVLDLAVQPFPLPLEVAEELRSALLGLRLEHLGAGARVRL